MWNTWTAATPGRTAAAEPLFRLYDWPVTLRQPLELLKKTGVSWMLRSLFVRSDHAKSSRTCRGFIADEPAGGAARSGRAGRRGFFGARRIDGGSRSSCQRIIRGALSDWRGRQGVNPRAGRRSCGRGIASLERALRIQRLRLRAAG